MLWSGSLVSIPAGWQLCNGTNGTPDLRDRFVPGAGTAYTPGDTGGNTQHTHTFTGTGHLHDMAGFPGNLSPAATYDFFTDDGFLTGTTDPTSSSPPYYSLAYIMFLGL